MQTFEDFRRSFTFRSELSGAIGVTQEFFLADHTGKCVVPKAPLFLSAANGSGEWVPTLSACKVKGRLNPVMKIETLEIQLRRQHARGEQLAASTGGRFFASESPLRVPEDVYPDNERYRRIPELIGRDAFLASIGSASTHIHIGVGSLAQAVEVSNALLLNAPELMRLATYHYTPDSQRLRQQSATARHILPPRCHSVRGYYELARDQGFVDNPRNCRHLIRITRQGAVEARFFGLAYDKRGVYDPRVVVHWAKEIRRKAGF